MTTNCTAIIQNTVEKIQQESLPKLQPRIALGALYTVSNLHHLHSSGITFAHKDSTRDIGFRQTLAKHYNYATDYARECVGVPDTYIGVNGIIPFRSRSNETVTHLTSNFVDLDCYNVGLSPDETIERALIICQQNHLPYPSEVYKSGRGVYLIWLYNHPTYVGAQNKEKGAWIKGQFVIVQELLAQLFSSLGADSSCKDPARILRLGDTINSKSGETVVGYDVIQGAQPRTRHNAVTIKNAVLAAALPINAPQPPQPQKPARTATPGDYYYNSREQYHQMLNKRTLVYTRMEDLRTLADLRGGILYDHREMSIFYYAISAAVFCNTRDSLLREVSLFMQNHIHCVGKYNHQRPERLLASVLSRHEKTRQARFHGNLVLDLNYKARNQTIIDALEITREEQASLKTIISADEKKSRDAKYQKDKRRAGGAVEREEYDRQRADKLTELTQKAVKLKTEGWKQKDIAIELGVTNARISQLLKPLKKS